MKKGILLLLVVLMATFLLSGCYAVSNVYYKNTKNVCEETTGNAYKYGDVPNVANPGENNCYFSFSKTLNDVFPAIYSFATNEVFVLDNVAMKKWEEHTTNSATNIITSGKPSTTTNSTTQTTTKPSTSSKTTTTTKLTTTKKPTTTKNTATTKKTSTPTTTHKHNYIEKTQAATCQNAGRVYKECKTCRKQITIKTLPKVSCSWYWMVEKASTCTTDGMLYKNCKWCLRNYDYTVWPKSGHWWDVKKDIFATPENDGFLSQVCKNCGLKEDKTIKFKANGETNLCIPALKLNCEVYLGECNQANTDAYDVSCDMNFIDAKNPLFFGHDYRSLGNICTLKKGDIIYFTKDNKTTKYKVVLSEQAQVTNGGIDIVGIKSGTSVLEKFSKEILHFFTCYRVPSALNGRWIVLAEKVS